MTTPLVLLDADALGRQRTGDETYVSALLAELPKLGGDLRFAAVTRRPDLVPQGVEPIVLDSEDPALVFRALSAWTDHRLSGSWTRV